MQPNHTLSVANIVENRYTLTEPPDVEREGRFTVGKLVGQGRNRDGTNQGAGDGNSIRLAANTNNEKSCSGRTYLYIESAP